MDMAPFDPGHLPDCLKIVLHSCRGFFGLSKLKPRGVGGRVSLRWWRVFFGIIGRGLSGWMLGGSARTAGIGCIVGEYVRGSEDLMRTPPPPGSAHTPVSAGSYPQFPETPFRS
uniref:Uncharacterized protein n=1 Tax=Candidatus Methanogaster sp. ANME-2c ERB4 TaxID=2759911 RepID=A0A7G9Y6E9_9EURY|nr:hypothetical protein MNENOFAE_00002 [Methanosarcinales archaeon ANME-2c ERB4]QNO44673.1 hypothetical protein FAIAHACK_00010 [Methanosarcinales archaeon ANME-2c ERB4]